MGIKVKVMVSTHPDGVFLRDSVCFNVFLEFFYAQYITTENLVFIIDIYCFQLNIKARLLAFNIRTWVNSYNSTFGVLNAMYRHGSRAIGSVYA